ncbi:translation initiation factor IF-2 [Thermaurantiacus sp.]
MSDDDKPKLGLRPALARKRTTEVSQVKQSFSHGRTHKVVVETKKVRVLRRPGESADSAPPEAAAPVKPPEPAVADLPSPAPSARGPGLAKPVAPLPPRPIYRDGPVEVIAPKLKPAEPPAPAPPAAPAAPAAPVAHREPSPPPAGPAREVAPPAPKPPPPVSPELARIQKALRNPNLTPREKQQLMVRLAEAERLARAEEIRIREERERAEAEAAERRRLEEKARAEAEEKRRLEDQARAEAEAPVPQTAGLEEEEEEGRRRAGPPGRRAPEPTRPTRGRGDDRRQSGKLTIARALGDDDGIRARSIASIRRAHEKQRRAHGGGATANQAKAAREVQIPEVITVQELANRMAERGADLVKALFKMGMPTTITATIDQDTAELLVVEFGHTPRRVSDADVELGLEGTSDAEADLKPRPPVITIMGHVDHGKTSLLDALRGTDVAAGEAGGITQHIGAYQIAVPSGERITFLDTPGHEAFTEMRARGASVTDIVVLVVAADDGLKPQTIEAINHVKAAGVPMIVAINKMDKPEADAQRVRTELLQHDVQVEAMGGEVLDVEVSALRRTGLSELIEKILLQAELLELKANPKRTAEGIVIEAKLDKGRGPVATVLVRRGTLRQGDIFVVGAEWGKVRALLNDKGQTVKEAGPAFPVEVLGLSGVPAAGDRLTVVETEARAREIAAYRQKQLTAKRTAQAPATLESMFSAMKQAKAQEFPVVVKADVHGSAEAIVNAVQKLSTEEIRVRVLHSGVGAITESDVTLARASGALIIGFNVRANAKAREVAHQAGVPLKYYDVIYELLDELRVAMAGKLGPEYVETVVGRAEVRQVFQAGKFGKAAGCLVTEGLIRRNLKARVLRDDVIVYNGAIASLRRFKDDVTEVQKGYECGIGLEAFNDIREGDVIETFEIEERVRSL